MLHNTQVGQKSTMKQDFTYQMRHQTSLYIYFPNAFQAEINMQDMKIRQEAPLVTLKTELSKANREHM